MDEHLVMSAAIIYLDCESGPGKVLSELDTLRDSIHGSSQHCIDEHHIRGKRADFHRTKMKW